MVGIIRFNNFFIKQFILILSLFVCLCGDVAHAARMIETISDDSAEVFGSKLKYGMENDEINCGFIGSIRRAEEFDRHGEQEDIFAYVSAHLNDDHFAMIIYHESSEKKLSSITIIPNDANKETYLKAVLPVLTYSLTNIGLTLQETEKLLYHSALEDVAGFYCPSIGKKIVLVTKKPEGNETTEKYVILAL